MAPAHGKEGPAKAWIEPDRWTFARAFPGQAAAFACVVVLCAVLGVTVHPLFWAVVGFALIRQASLDASLRELFREGMLHPAQRIDGPKASGLVATLVRLDGERGVQDAVMISQLPRGLRRSLPPWEQRRVAVVIAGEPPQLRPLSPEVAGVAPERARKAAARIPERQWQALARALGQIRTPEVGLHLVELGREPWYEAGPEDTQGMPPHLSENDTSLWCAALPCIEDCSMVEPERTRARFLRRKARARALFRSAAFVLTLPGFWWLWHGPLTSLGSPVALLGLTLVLLAPVLLAAALRSISQARALSRDLHKGRVRRFAGPLSNYDSLAFDRDLALLFRHGLLAAEPDLHEELVVLPESGQLLYAGKRWAEPGIVLGIQRVAERPESPVQLALPSELLRGRPSSAVRLSRRKLTPLEREELEAHARGLRRPGPAFFWVCALLAVALGAWQAEGFRVPPTSLGVPIAWLAACLSAWSAIRRFRLSLRLDADVALGWVLVADPGDGKDSAELPALGVETLLNARLDWSVNNRPAAWRRLGGLR